MNPKVDDIPEKFSVSKDGVRLLVLGTIPQGGGGCFCGENVLLKSLLSHLFVERDEYVVVDMEAGLEHLGRGTTAYMDALLVVVEPGQRSMQTARQVKSLADDLGIKRVYIVGNKVVAEPDIAMMKEHLAGLPFLGYMSQNEKILEADKLGVSPYDLDGKIRSEVSRNHRGPFPKHNDTRNEMRRVLSFLNLVVTTIVLSTVALCASPFDRGGEVSRKLSRLWAHIYLRIAGVKVTVTGVEKAGDLTLHLHVQPSECARYTRAARLPSLLLQVHREEVALFNSVPRLGHEKSRPYKP